MVELGPAAFTSPVRPYKIRGSSAKAWVSSGPVLSSFSLRGKAAEKKSAVQATAGQAEGVEAWRNGAQFSGFKVIGLPKKNELQSKPIRVDEPPLGLSLLWGSQKV